MREGLRFLGHQRVVRALTLLGFGNSFTSGAVYGLLVVYAVRAIGLSSDSAAIGVLFAAAAAGALAASASLHLLVKRVPVTWLSLIGLSLNAVFVLALAANGSFGFGVVLLALWQAANSLVIVNGISLRQTVTPEHLQGRVNTAARMVAWGGQPFGAAVAGVLATSLNVQAALAICAAAAGLSAIVGFTTPLRHRDAVTLGAVDATGPAVDPATLISPIGPTEGIG